MSRLREIAKEKQRRHEDDSVVFGVRCADTVYYFDPRRQPFAECDDLKA